MKIDNRSLVIGLRKGARNEASDDGGLILMIHGIGTDLVTVSRFDALFWKDGARIADSVLAPAEREACAKSAAPGRFLARSFAAKEALGKALGSGIREPVTLPAIEVSYGAQGKAKFVFHGVLADYVRQRGLRFHLAISDELDYALACVIAEIP